MPYNPDHANHTIQFDYPGGDNLQVKAIVGKEKLSGLFKFQMDLISNDGNLDFKTVVGQKVTAKLFIDDDSSKGDGGYRYFNGIITEFSYLGFEYEDVYRYRATVRPWFWLLTRTSDCRIFQKMKVPDIVKEVFKLNNMVDFKLNLKATYREWEYCVQYNESDYDFISRLLEQEGIYYFFKHEDGKHVMVMVDDPSSHEVFPGFDSVPFNAGFAGASLVEDSLHYCAETKNITPSTYTIQDYDFEHPKADLLARFKNEPKTKGKSAYDHPLSDPEIFSYPGEYVVRNEGNNYAEIRLQELQCRWERMNASGDCRGLAPGCTFTLKESPREDQNKKYLTVSIKHKMHNHDYRSGQSSFEGEDELTPYQCEIEAIDAIGIRFRAPRTTPKPIVQGPQTAVVVGPSGDEIYTDEYGRVKVQFHWDRYGQNDENSSCWMRVSTMWAGTKWGGIHIPRIGQEVIVNFLEGDPDRPLITGSVYNGNCMPPYELAAHKTQSGIKSRSTTGGSADNFNEIRFEDRIGEEELYIHAEKNHTNITENDRNENVGHDRTCKVGHDYKLDVGNDALVNIGYGDGKGSYSMNVCQDRIESVSNGDYKIAVDTGSRELFINTNDKIEVKGNQTVVVAKTLDSQCKDFKMTGSATMVAKSPDVKIQGAANTYIGDAAIKMNGTTIDVKGATINITGTGALNLACGASSVKLSAAGVKISGPIVNINS